MCYHSFMETTPNTTNETKVVIIIASHLPIGLAANRAAVLATGLAAHVSKIIGSDLVTKDGITLLSFTQIPIPILTAKPEVPLLPLADKSKELGCQVIYFLSRAQGMRSYEEYKQSVAQSNYQELDVDAITIWGDKKMVTKVTGNLPALR